MLWWFTCTICPRFLCSYPSVTISALPSPSFPDFIHSRSLLLYPFVPVPPLCSQALGPSFIIHESDQTLPGKRGACTKVLDFYTGCGITIL